MERRRVRAALERMAKMGMNLEIELGVTGGEEDGIGGEFDESADNAKLYTQPEDVLHAYDVLNPIGQLLRRRVVRQRPRRVQARQREAPPGDPARTRRRRRRRRTPRARNPLNLVFHGGSGSEKEKITEAVSYGVFKMNIDTDTQFAFSEPVGTFVDAAREGVQVPDRPRRRHAVQEARTTRASGCGPPRQGMVARLGEAFADLGATGRTLAG